MPFRPGEQVSMRFVGAPAKATFEFLDTTLTVANGGLTVQHDGSLRVVVTLPATPGWYPYRFKAGKVEEDGTLRVVAAQPTPEPTPPEPGSSSYSG